MEAIHGGESVKAVATGNAVKESQPIFSLKPPPGVPILGSLETGEFMANGVGPGFFRTGPLKSNYSLWLRKLPESSTIPQINFTGSTDRHSSAYQVYRR